MYKKNKTRKGGLAHLVERVICIDEARGSKPRISNFCFHKSLLFHQKTNKKDEKQNLKEKQRNIMREMNLGHS